MASIIKNQLVKHLSKFTKNLKPEQISLDVLKGKSKLHFIEINEDVLAEVLELPSWIRIKRATCLGVTVSVPWTKLKSSPVQIFIDEISVEVVMCGGVPPAKKTNLLSGFGDNASYGFVDKVVEGMSLYINTVEIQFDSEAFGGSFMLSRLAVESRTPGWQVPTDLRHTRISLPATNRTILHKHVTFQLLRIEASAKTDKNEKRRSINQNLRLITSGGRIRISLKKNSSDGSVVFARILTILDEILWVATLPQLRSALLFYNYIMELIKQSQKDNPVMIPVSHPRPVVPNQNHEPTSGATYNEAVKHFDFHQTSHHLYLQKIDLHLCDDSQIAQEYPPGWDINSGAMQVTLSRVLFDVYPRTLVTSTRTDWLRYDAPKTYTTWMQTRLAEQLLKLTSGLDETGRTRLSRCWPQLMSFNVVVRVYDVTIQCLSEMNSKKESIKELMFSDRQNSSLPNDQYIVHFEFANFFHPMTDSLPVPCPATYLQVGPLSLRFHQRTLRWALYVAHYLISAIDHDSLPEMDALPHTDVKIDLLMPKVILPLPDPSSDARLPHNLILSLSTLSISNTQFQAGDNGFFKQLTKVGCVNVGQHQIIPVPGACQGVVSYARKLSLLGGKDTFLEDLVQMNEGPVTRGSDCEQFWLQSTFAWVDTDHGSKTKPLPVISDVCIAGTITVRPDRVHVYIEPTTTAVVTVDHFQFLQITRFAAELTDFLDILAVDQRHFSSGKDDTSPTVVLLASIQKIRLHLLLTMGPQPSPYDRCPAIFAENSFIDGLTDTLNTRSNTPRRTPAANTEESRNRQIMVEFPDIPKAQDFETGSVVDDSMSMIGDSLEDEYLDYENDDDPFQTDQAEEASAIDVEILNDRIYKSLMAMNGNVLKVCLSQTTALVNVVNKNTRVLGAVDEVDLKYGLNVSRQDVYEESRVRDPMVRAKQKLAEQPLVTFSVNVSDQSSVSIVQAEVVGLKTELDDEVVTHLSAFVVDEQLSENKVRLGVSVKESDISIRDRKKKKPLRIRIKEVVIEQDEDDKTDVEED